MKSETHSDSVHQDAPTGQDVHGSTGRTAAALRRAKQLSHALCAAVESACLRTGSSARDIERAQADLFNHLSAALTEAAEPVRMLTKKECDAVVEVKAWDTYADYANLQRAFARINGLTIKEPT